MATKAVRCSSRRSFRRRSGMTLIELLVVIGIIGIMVSLLMPAVMSVREKARTLKCANNLRQIGLAVQLFQHTYGEYPTSWKPGAQLDDRTYEGWSLHAQKIDLYTWQSLCTRNGQEPNPTPH